MNDMNHAGMVHDDPAMQAEHMAALALVPHDQATHIAIADGDWSDPGTWAGGVVPGADARVLISDGVHVTYDTASDVRLFTVRVDGHLDFATDIDTKMVLDTMVVDPGGELTIGTVADPVQGDVTAEIVIANNGPIDTNWDPMLLSRGIIAHGKTQMHGEEKTSHLKVADDPMAGDTSVTLSEVPENWQVGDTIVIAGTHYDGYHYDSDAPGGIGYTEPEDEVRTITRIEGDQVFFDDPLEHDHDSPREDLKTSVANYTRNVSIETEDPDTAEVFERGHVMFMHNDDVDVRFVEFHELGRTDKSESSFDVGDINNPDFDDNVRGRYAVHLHRTGVDNVEDPAMLIGNAVYGSPGWGYVHHDSNAHLIDNASYDTFGAGFVAETGNEIGRWDGNIAIDAQGTKWAEPKNANDIQEFDLGRSGDGFWFQGRMVESVDNVAASVNHGFVYFHRGPSDGSGDLPFDSSLFDYPEAVGLDDSVDPNETPILSFSGNETFAARQGLHVVKHGGPQGHDVYSQLEDFTAWSVYSGAQFSYTAHYILRDFDVVAREDTSHGTPWAGISFSRNTSDMVVIDANVEGFTKGITGSREFTFGFDQSEVDFTVINATVTGAQVDIEGFDTVLDQAPADTGLSVNLGGSLVYNEYPFPNPRVVEITGYKTDSLGRDDLPSGGDNFDADYEEVKNILATHGYFTDASGQRYFVLEDYYTDRVTGELHKFGTLVAMNGFIDYEGMIYNGEIDLNSAAPIAVDDSAQTAVGHEVVIQLLANDSDPDGDALEIDGIVQPKNGQVFMREDGNVLYRPDYGFEGEDGFSYWASDGFGNFTKANVTVQVSGEGDGLAWYNQSEPAGGGHDHGHGDGTDDDMDHGDGHDDGTDDDMDHGDGHGDGTDDGMDHGDGHGDGTDDDMDHGDGHDGGTDDDMDHGDGHDDGTDDDMDHGDGHGDGHDGGNGAALDPVFALSETLSVSRTADAVLVAPQDAPNIPEGTIAFSFNADEVAGRFGLMSRDAKGFSGDGNHISIVIEMGTLKVRLQDGSETMMQIGGIEAGRDYHLALTFDGSEAELFLDGSSVSTASTGFSWATSPEYLQIGALGWSSNSGHAKTTAAFDGTIDDFAIYDTPLDTTQISALADGETPVGDDGESHNDVVESDEPADSQENASQDEVSQVSPAPVTPPVDEPAPPPADEPETPEESEAPEAPAAPAEPFDVENGTVLTISNGLDVIGGRVTTLAHDGDDIQSIRVLEKPAFGNLTANPDNTMALVLSTTDQTGPISFSYEVTYADGTTEQVNSNLDVVAGPQAAGWGAGEFYMLETDAEGDVVVEHGDVHRKVYISESDEALSKADIALLEDLDPSQITGAWLAANPEYGSDEFNVLAPDAGMALWYEITGNGQQASHWLLFEKGHDYGPEDLGFLLDRASQGESELNPLYIGAWGDGDKPQIDAKLWAINGWGTYENIVVQGLHFTDGASIQTGSNILFDDVTFTQAGVDVQFAEAVTIRNADFYDIVRDAPANGASDWTAEAANRISGLFSRETDHLLMEGLYVDQVGWADDYRQDLSGEGGQPPSIYSQNIYIQYSNTDVTLRDSITMQAASYGMQLRSGGVVDDVVFLDNNAALSLLGGDYNNAGPVGNYSLVVDSLITSGAHKTVDGLQGALTLGLQDEAEMTALVDSIVAHLADPDNLAELAARYWSNPALITDTPYFNDTVVYNWVSGRDAELGVQKWADENTGGLDEATLDDTTIQNFTAELLGGDGTVAQLSAYLQAIAAGEIDAELTADDILDYFDQGFGQDDTANDGPVTLTFVPDDRGDGIRWDNDLNWAPQEAPEDGDSVDLAGNWVNYAGTVELDTLDFGPEGMLDVSQGRLDVDTLTGTGTLNIDDAGQVHAAGNDGELDITVEGGRFANTGTFDGLFELIARDGQTLVGVDEAEMTLGEGDVLTIEGSEAQVGFDGEEGGVSLLEMDGGVLAMTADANGLATIEEFRSGQFEGETPNVLSAFDMGEGSLLLDITELGNRETSEVLVEVDEMVGMFDDIRIIGLAGDQDATLIFDYTADTVTLNLSAPGTGAGVVNVQREGDEGDAADNAAIWDVLTDGQGTYEELDDTPEILDEDDDILAA